MNYCDFPHYIAKEPGMCHVSEVIYVYVFSFIFHSIS